MPVGRFAACGRNGASQRRGEGYEPVGETQNPHGGCGGQTVKAQIYGAGVGRQTDGGESFAAFADKAHGAVAVGGREVQPIEQTHGIEDAVQQLAAHESQLFLIHSAGSCCDAGFIGQRNQHLRQGEVVEKVIEEARRGTSGD